jgi:hypothetical protein
MFADSPGPSGGIQTPNQEKHGGKAYGPLAEMVHQAALCLGGGLLCALALCHSCAGYRHLIGDCGNMAGRLDQIYPVSKG